MNTFQSVYFDHQSAARVADNAAPGLVWSEVFYLLGVVAAAAVTLSPFGWDLASWPLLKHLPLLITIPTLVLSFVGARLKASPSAPSGIGAVMTVAWPLAVLALMVVTGSLIARQMSGIQTTFINMGLGMTALFAAAAMVIFSQAPSKLIRAFTYIVCVMAWAMTFALGWNFGVREVYHEQIFLVIPMAVYCFLAWRGVMRWVGLSCFLAAGLLSAKNTSYLIVLLVVIYLVWLRWWPVFKQTHSLERIAAAYLAFLVLIVCAVGFALLFYHRDQYLPSGNVEFRSYTYHAAWDRFLQSPLWGTGFAVGSVNKFTLYTVGVANNVLPTHSDIMDLLAHGGVLAIALWMAGLLRIARVALSHLLAPRHMQHPWAPVGHTMAVISLAGIVTYAFNPVLLHTGTAYLLWSCLGLLLGVALRIRQGDSPSEDDMGLYTVSNAVAGGSVTEFRNGKYLCGERPEYPPEATS